MMPDFLQPQSAKTNKIIIACGIIIATAIIATSSAMAYLLGSKDTTGEVTIGKCEIEIEEEFTPPEKIEPDCHITKKPWINNIGTVPCYIRMRADVSIGQIEPYLSIDFNTTEWSSKKDDGYYYYQGTAENRGILNPDASSEPLFTEVIVSDTIPQELVTNFEIFVYAEAVQAEGFDNADEAWARYTPDSTI